MFQKISILLEDLSKGLSEEDKIKVNQGIIGVLNAANKLQKQIDRIPVYGQEKFLNPGNFYATVDQIVSHCNEVMEQHNCNEIEAINNWREGAPVYFGLAKYVLRKLNGGSWPEDSDVKKCCDSDQQYGAWLEEEMEEYRYSGQMETYQQNR